MSLYETSHSSGTISLAALLRGEPQRGKAIPLTVADIMQRVVIGGWPSLLDTGETEARRWLTDYLTQIVEIDVPSLDDGRRPPRKLRRALSSLARSVGQSVTVTSIAQDLTEGGGEPASRTLVYTYLDALDRLKLLDNSPAWRPHMRSRTQLREAPVRYFVDPSLGTAALGVGSKDLLADIRAAGFHFEALVVRDLRIYAQPLGGTVYSWREAHGRKEVDAVVETPSGWAAFEVKLSNEQAVIDKAARTLSDFASVVDPDRHGPPSALGVITLGTAGGRRADGIHVIPITALGP